MSFLVFEIYNLHRNAEYVITVKREALAKELCLIQPAYVYKPVIVAENIGEARVLIKERYDNDE